MSEDLELSGLTKQELRKSLLDIRSGMPENLSKVLSYQICDLAVREVEKITKDPSDVYIGVYNSANNEVDLTLLITDLFGRGYHICLPCVYHGQMEFCEVSLDEYCELNDEYFYIDCEEPIQKNKLDLIFVPLVAFDELNNRIGYGTGCYDKFAVDFDKEKLIGVAFEEQKVDKIPTSDLDKPLGKILYC